MYYEGSPELLRNLFRKKRLLEQGDASHARYKTFNLACSGMMRGTYGVGQCLALYRFGLNQVFDVACGISTGLPTLCYTLSGQERYSIYWKEAASKEFVSWTRFFRGKGPYIDIDYICRVFQDIDQEAVRRSRTEIWGGATCARTGKPLFFNLKTDHADMVEIIRASSALPGFTPPVAIGEHLCNDGATALTFPVQQIIERWEPTEVLILANREKISVRPGLVDTIASAITMRGLPQEVQRANAMRLRVAQSELEFARAQSADKVRIGILWCDGVIQRRTRDSSKLEAAAMRAHDHLSLLLADAKAYVDAEQSSSLAA